MKALARGNAFFRSASALLFSLFLAAGCADTETRTIVVEEVDLEKVSDGTYRGEHAWFPVKVVVDVEVENHEISRSGCFPYQTSGGRT